MVTQSYVLPQSVVQQPTGGQFYQASPPPAPYIPATFVQTTAPQIRPQAWVPPQPAGFRIPVAPAAPQMIATVAPPTPIQYQHAGPTAPWAPMHFPVPSALAPSSIGYYGYAPDSMWTAVAQVPPMWRPQQPGENFMTRVVKNLMLILVEHGLQQLVFATRQAFLPPPYQSAPAIDVTPRAPTT